MPPKAVPNGTADASTHVPTLPAVLGVNFGNTFASIAVFTKEGLAECIATEDGERQIACAISFFGEEMYIGNQAVHQLVKNSQNTITGFRNLLGKKFSEIPQSSASKSAPVIQHPDIPDEPAYKVTVLQPAPTPLPPATSTYNTPLASQVATPRSEPIQVTRFLTVSEVTTIFLGSLLESAQNFLGRKIEGAVLTVPAEFTPAQRSALRSAAENAGLHVLQLLEEAGAAAATTTSPLWSAALPQDRTQLVVDLGASSLSLSLLSIRAGLALVLASSHTPDINADLIDAKLIKFFAADFTKKTKIPLAVCPASGVADARAEARLRLAIEHTKRTISASPGAATCSVESLKDGADYTGSINRMRFDLVVGAVYSAVSSAVGELLASAAVDPFTVDEIIYVGGSTCLPGLDERLCLAAKFREDVETPFSRGTVVGGGIGDPTTVLARGCAMQAALIAAIPEGGAHTELRGVYSGSDAAGARATSKTVGVLLPHAGGGELGGTWIPVVHKETPLPARRAVRFDVELTDASKKVALEVWEVNESIRVEKVVPAKPDEDDEDDEEPEEEEVKHPVTTMEQLLGAVSLEALLGIKAKGKGKDAGKWTTVLEVQFVVSEGGALKFEVKEVGEGGATYVSPSIQ